MTAGRSGPTALRSNRPSGARAPIRRTSERVNPSGPGGDQDDEDWPPPPRWWESLTWRDAVVFWLACAVLAVAVTAIIVG